MLFIIQQFATQGGPITTTPYLLTNGIVQEVTPTSLIISTNIQHTPDHRYLKGNVYLGSALNLGGGIRVKSITLNEPVSNKKSSTFYEYQNGVTSFEPVVTDDFNANTGYSNIDSFYKEMMLQGFVRLVTVGREIPSPGVIYETVNVREKFTDENGSIQIVPEYSQYKFQTFLDGMIVEAGLASSNTNVTGVSQTLAYSRIETVKKAIRNFTQFVGNLKSITLYDGQGRKSMRPSIITCMMLT
ncbi:MAG: hypothetical protein IPJ20_19545 [Flammeovirgaceae bacterium]|nr:hypothetical protein [Flammeovirgaceae bacterium]